MHSSRMRTARLLPVSPGMHCSQRGVYLVLGAGVPGPRGGQCTWFQGIGVYLVPGGCTWSQGRGCTWSWGMYMVLGGGPGTPPPEPGTPPTWSWGVYLVLGGVPGLGVVSGPQGVYLVPGEVFAPRGCTWFRGGCTWSWGVYLPRYSPPYGQNHRRLWKYNLAPTSLRAVITNYKTFCQLCPSERNCLRKWCE